MLAAAPANAAPTTGDDARSTAVRRRQPPRPTHRIAHDGFIADLHLGTVGCARDVCRGEHGARPGLRINGFLGGNIAGFLELGVQGGWGMLRASVAEGTPVLSLYGIDPERLLASVVAGEADLQGLEPDVGLEIASLRVEHASLSSAQVGPMMRVHLLPRGRAAAYLGTGLSYSLFQARYRTNQGPVRVDLHGLSVPLQAGMAVFITPHVALGVEATFLWSHHELAVLDLPSQRLTIPVPMLQDMAQSVGSDLTRKTPHLWTVTTGLRVRLGPRKRGRRR